MFTALNKQKSQLEIQTNFETNKKNEEKKQNKKCSCFFLLPSWCVILSIILAVGFVIVLIATAVLMFYFQMPALYTQSCLNKLCHKSLNLKCIKGTCLCDKNYFYAKGCRFKKNYLERCSSNYTNECLDNTGLMCSNGICICNESSYWDGQQCTAKQIYGGKCQSSDIQCVTDAFLRCDIKSGKCLCSIDRCFYLNIMSRKTIH